MSKRLKKRKSLLKIQKNQHEAVDDMQIFSHTDKMNDDVLKFGLDRNIASKAVKNVFLFQEHGTTERKAGNIASRYIPEDFRGRGCPHHRHSCRGTVLIYQFDYHKDKNEPDASEQGRISYQ